MRVALLALLVLGTAAAFTATADTPPPAKASALAPRGHSANRVYGTPIEPKILGHVYRQPRKASGKTHS